MENFKRSVEFEAILQKKPTFLIRWGVYLLCTLLILTALSSRFMGYPLAIPGRIIGGKEKRIYVEKRYGIILSRFIGNDIDLVNNDNADQKYTIRLLKIIYEKNGGVMVYIDKTPEKMPHNGEVKVYLLARSTIYNYIFQK